MQSTSNTASFPPVRPKIGRPPASAASFQTPAPSSASPPIYSPLATNSPDSQSANSKAKSVDMRLVVFSMAILLAVALVVGQAVIPLLNKVPATKVSAATSPADAATPVAAGTLIPPALPDATVSYSAEPQSQIDNQDRERLRLILNKD